MVGPCEGQWSALLLNEKSKLVIHVTLSIHGEKGATAYVTSSSVDSIGNGKILILEHKNKELPLWAVGDTVIEVCC